MSADLVGKKVPGVAEEGRWAGGERMAWRVAVERARSLAPEGGYGGGLGGGAVQGPETRPPGSTVLVVPVRSHPRTGRR